MGTGRMLGTAAKGVTGASMRAEPASGDFTIGAGRPDIPQKLKVGARTREDSWQQVGVTTAVKPLEFAAGGL